MTANELNDKYLSLLASGMTPDRAARYLFDNFRADVIDIMYSERGLLPTIKTTIKPINPAESLIDKAFKPLQSVGMEAVQESENIATVETLKEPAQDTTTETPKETNKPAESLTDKASKPLQSAETTKESESIKGLATDSRIETTKEANETTQSPANVLESYLRKGIALIPSKDKRPLFAYKQDDSKLIRDLQTLNEWQSNGVTEFGFTPSRVGLIVIDLDNSSNHANKTNGIENFKRLLECSNLANDDIFKDFPRCFPCYTTTANGGLHLYFDAFLLSASRAKEFDTAKLNSMNIEIKLNTKVTSAGSVINGKPYTLHGNLDDIPTMTIPIIDALSKPAQKPQRKTFARRFEKSDNRGLWNETPQSIIDKAIEKYNGLEPHNFAYKTAVLFKRAGFDLQTAETYILNTPQHINRNDQKDTITAIESIFR